MAALGCLPYSWMGRLGRTFGVFVYHLAGGGSVSRYDFTRAILELDPKKSEHKVKSVIPIRTEDFPLPAQRPLRTPLDCTKAHSQFGVALPDWRDALARALSDG